MFEPNEKSVFTLSSSSPARPPSLHVVATTVIAVHLNTSRDPSISSKKSGRGLVLRKQQTVHTDCKLVLVPGLSHEISTVPVASKKSPTPPTNYKRYNGHLAGQRQNSTLFCSRLLTACTAPGFTKSRRSHAQGKCGPHPYQSRSDEALHVQLERLVARLHTPSSST
jgi:hypothetical protein